MCVYSNCYVVCNLTYCGGVTRDRKRGGAGCCCRIKVRMLARGLVTLPGPVQSARAETANRSVSTWRDVRDAVATPGVSWPASELLRM